jgi:hypothetical protein
MAMCEAQRVGSWPAVLQQATVEDGAIVYLTKSYFEHKIRDLTP